MSCSPRKLTDISSPPRLRSPVHRRPALRVRQQEECEDRVQITTLTGNFHTEEARAALRTGVNLFARFRGDFQESGCNYVLASPNNLVLVGPTSAGKTFFWMLPIIGRIADETDKLTVVIAPLVALLEDLHRAAGQLGVAAKTWGEGERGLGSAQLVFAPAEAILFDGFKKWLHSQRHRLVRRSG